MSSDEYRRSVLEPTNILEEVSALRTQVIGLLVSNEVLTLDNFKLRSQLYGPQSMDVNL